MKRNIFYSLLLVFSLIAQSYTQLSPFATGIQKYRQGDLEGAITDFETVLAADKENMKAKEYFLNCLIASTMKFIQENEYTKAEKYIDRALELSPEDSEIKQLYQTVKNKLAEKVVPPSAPAIPSPPAVAPQAPAVAPQAPAPKVEKPPVVSPILPMEAPEVKEAKPIVPQKAEKIIGIRKELSPELEEKLTLLLATFEQERNAFREYLHQQEEKGKKIQKQFLILTISALLVFTFLFLGNLETSLRTKEVAPSKTENRILELKEKEYQIALRQRKKEFEERTKQMEEEKLKLQIAELQKFSEIQLTEIKEKFLEEKNLLNKEFEEKIIQVQEEKEKMLSEINKLQKMKQGLENQLQQYLKEKKLREEKLRILLYPLSRQRTDLAQYLGQWKIKQRNETISYLLKMNKKTFAF